MGPAEAAKRVDVYLGQRSEGPVGVWERFEAEFTSVGFDLPYTLVLSNWTKGAVTAWFDDVRIEEVEPR
jgi:hypothetical protein